jgi:hypothetical protein
MNMEAKKRKNIRNGENILVYSFPFLIRNIKYKNIDKEKIKIMKKNYILKNELEFYQSIFKTHYDSVIFNLKIKKVNGKRMWIDRIKINSDYKLLNTLDKDNDVIEWLTPVRCER